MSPDQVNSSVALVGSPNSGKTTLFNWLTGSSFKTVNYAGSTVDCFRGRTLPIYGASYTVLDTPGVYSLQPHGRDEEATFQVLTESSDVQAVVVVLDGTQLNRQLYLVRQLQELKFPMVVAVTMVDILKKTGRVLNFERLSELLDCPVVGVDGRLGGGVQEVVDLARTLSTVHHPHPRKSLDWDELRIEKEIAIAESWARQVVHKSPGQQTLDHLRRWDSVLLHPFWGIFVFLFVMGGLFSSIFWLAAPLMDWVDWIFSFAAEFVVAELGNTGASDFLANGLIGGVGAVLVFVPQIFVLFLGFTLLEDSGYLARAATIVDRPLNYLGLSGRAFVPLLSGFACAVPAVMATRNIRSARERWIAVFIIPFMTCSARLPVYALLLTFLFYGSSAWIGGLALTGLYTGGLLVSAIAAGVLNKILGKDSGSHFLMELPIYRWPKLSFTFRIAARRTYSYVKKAGPTILGFVLVLWVGTHFPYYGDEDPALQLRQSYVGQIGAAAEPVFEPMGLDWRAGLGMISAFVAREVFVSAMAVIFSITDEDEDSLQNSLLEKMRQAEAPDGMPLFTPASVIGLLIFFMIALQCLSTTAVVWREMGSWKFAITQLIVMNLLAYGLAVAAVQGLRAFGIS